MTRRTIITVLIAILVAALVGVLWYTFFRSAPSTNNATSGTFGTSAQKPGTSGNTQTPATNIPSSVNQTGSGSVNNGGTILVQTGVTTTPSGSTPQDGINWLAGGGTGGSISGGSGSTFTPATINQLNNGQVGGQVTVLGTGGATVQDSNGSNFLGTALAGAALGTALCTAGFLSQGGALAGGAASVGASTALDAGGVPVRATGVVTQLGITNSIAGGQAFKEDFLDCITRTIAKAALQQITSSVVNWINSGFNGSPSFVTNPKQFFTNVADQAAGAYIQGSALSFLCSPFQLKVKIAIAQSYAQRNAQSCSLSKAIGNVTAFANGNFSQGGWGGLLQFTTVPTNNPYGAFAYGQIGLTMAQQQAVGLKQQDLTLGQGFLSFTQKTGCTTATDSSGNPAQKCTGEKIVTPGRVIADSLGATQKSSLDSLNMAKSFDEIISALITQLITRTLYSGLSNLSGNNGGGYQTNFLTPDQQAAQGQGNQLLTSLQAFVTLAQQYGQIQQSSIVDIQNTQQQYSALENCWQSAASSTALTDTQQGIAGNNAVSAGVTLHSFDGQVSSLNEQITRANTAIVTLQSLQTRTLNVSSTAEVNGIAAELKTAEATGLLVSQNDVTQAQQDRASLQSRLSGLNTSATSQMNQCNAYGA